MTEKKNLHPYTAYRRIVAAIRAIDPKLIDALDRKDALNDINDVCYEVLWQDWMGEEDE